MLPNSSHINDQPLIFRLVESTGKTASLISYKHFAYEASAPLMVSKLGHLNGGRSSGSRAQTPGPPADHRMLNTAGSTDYGHRPDCIVALR